MIFLVSWHHKSLQPPVILPVFVMPSFHNPVRSQWINSSPLLHFSKFYLEICNIKEVKLHFMLSNLLIILSDYTNFIYTV